MLIPELFYSLRNYTWKQCRTDIFSGIMVGVVALPLAIAFAIASGVSPNRGFVTAIVAGFLISVLGGSRVQIGGPTGAFVVVVYGVVQKFGLEGLTIATLMGGVILVFFAIARFGNVIKFIPYPVTLGFTSGIAVIILISQVKDFFGLQIENVPAPFIEKLLIYAHHATTWNPAALLLGLGTILIIRLWTAFNKVIPGSLIALALGIIVTSFCQLPVETISSRFGQMPRFLPNPHLPAISFSLLQSLLPSAFAIAVLAGIESLLSALVADGMIGTKHRSNTELLAQGVANIASAIFGGIPATGAIARTATNVHNGGRTPIAGMVHALTLLLILACLGPLAEKIPLASLAGILMVVAWRMSEWRAFLMVLRAPRSDAAVLVITFLLTVLVDLTVAIEIGMVLAAFLLIHRLSLSTQILPIANEFGIRDEKAPELALEMPAESGVETYEIQGPFFFGVVATFIDVMKNIEQKPKVRILRLGQAGIIDATALNALGQIHQFCADNQIRLFLSEVQPQPMATLKQSGFLHSLGASSLFETYEEALKAARRLLRQTPTK